MRNYVNSQHVQRTWYIRISVLSCEEESLAAETILDVSTVEQLRYTHTTKRFSFYSNWRIFSSISSQLVDTVTPCLVTYFEAISGMGSIITGETDITWNHSENITSTALTVTPPPVSWYVCSLKNFVTA